MKNALLIFIKNPQLGKVKTRLAAAVGDEKALKIYCALLERTRRISLAVNAAKDSRLGVTPSHADHKAALTKYLFYSDFADETDNWQTTDFVKKTQHGDDLGERMANAFEEVLPAHEKAIIIGSDTPDLSAEILRQAFEKLDDFDFVIGRAEDGGYYLLGMKAVQPAVFQGINWSTPLVFKQTIAIIKNSRKTWFELPVLSDIDTETDWVQYGWDV